MGSWLPRYHPLGYRLLPRSDVLYIYMLGYIELVIIRSSEFKVGKPGQHRFYLDRKKAANI